MTTWPADVNDVMAGDLAVASAYVTPAGGVVVTGVATCGMADGDAGTVAFTTSLGFGKKLERIVADPHVTLAYHTREHGFSSDPRFVLAQGWANVELEPSRDRLEALAPQVTRYLGEVRRGPIWDRVLREYYGDRLFVDVDVARIVAWDNLATVGEPEVWGAPMPDMPAPQSPPKNGTGPRADADTVAAQLWRLPHRLLGYRGADGYPVVVPVDVAGHDRAGLRLVAAPGRLPPGGRRAGFLAHAYRPKLVGLATRTLTGWLDVADDGRAVYAPHTSKGFVAPPNKSLLLVVNGMVAKYGLRQALRHHLPERLAQLRAGVTPDTVTGDRERG